MSSLPTGQVTFLLTDIEGSTNLLQLLENRYVDVVGVHRRLLREAFQAWGGKGYRACVDAAPLAAATMRERARERRSAPTPEEQPRISEALKKPR